MAVRIWLRRWLPALAGGALTLLVLIILLGRTAQPIAAQQQAGIELEKRLLKNSNIVRVGEVLTFAITITNRWDASIITLPLTDDYDETILRFVDATPAPDIHDAASGTLEWNDLLSSAAPLAPAEQLVVTVRFIAEHPTADLRVVNRAFTHDAYDELERKVGDGSSSASGDADGGRLPVTKALAMTTPPVAGQPITFTLTLHNDGLANVVTVPVVDTYDASALQFWRAAPPPDSVTPGELRWSNILQPPLPAVLTPGEVVTATVVFTAVRDLDQTVNRVGVAGAQDSFGNDLEAAQDDAPIRILPNPDATAVPTATTAPTTAPRPTVEPTPTATPAPTRRPRDDETPAPTPIPATPEASATPEAATPEAATPEAVTPEAATPDVATPTPTQPAATPSAAPIKPTPVVVGGGGSGPRSLPETGAPAPRWPWLALLGVLLVALGTRWRWGRGAA